jgi:RNA polymerase sigma-70 factor (ECF subfamily)
MSNPRENEFSSEINVYQELDFNYLALNHHKKLLYFVLHKVRDEDDAQDIVQSTFMEAIKSSHNFRQQSKPETWLTGIAVNLIKNHFHQKKKKPTYYLEDEEMIEYASDEKSPPKALEEKQLMLEINNTFSNMPKEMRNTAEKVLLNNVSYEDASKLEIPPIPIGTVRSRVARAREMLRKLQDLYDV